MRIRLRHASLLLLAALVFFEPGASARAEVVQTNGPFGGDVTAVIAVDGVFWIGTGVDIDPNGGGRIFRSDDDGLTWQAADEGLPNRAIHAFVHSNGVLYAGTAQGVWRRADAASSWERADASFFYQTRSLAVTSAGDLLAGTQANGVWVSQDGGDSFAEMSTGLPFPAGISALLVDGADWWAGGTDDLDRAVVWKWDDAQQEWDRSLRRFSEQIVDSLEALDGKVFAGMRSRGLYVTANGGDDWDLANNGLPSPDFSIIRDIVASGDDLYLAYNVGVYKSTDGGQSFGAQDAVICNCDLPALEIAGNTLLLASSVGAWRSVNDGVDWTRQNEAIIASYVEDVVALDSGRLISGSRHAGVFLSDDQGASWRLPTTDLGDAFVRGLAVGDDGILYASSWTQGLLTSSDGGEIWRLRLITSGYEQMVALGNDAYAGSSTLGVRRGTNGGLDWEEVNDGLTDDRVTALISSGGALYAGTVAGQVHVADPAPPWTPIGTPLGLIVTGLARTASGDLWAIGLGGGPFVRAAGQTEFVLDDAGLPYGSGATIYADGDRLYLDLFGLQGASYTRGPGDTSWQPFDTGSPLRQNQVFQRVGDRLYLGTDASGVQAVLLPEPAAALGTGVVLLTLALAGRSNGSAGGAKIRRSRVATPATGAQERPGGE